MHFQPKKFAFFTYVLSQNSSPGSYCHPCPLPPPPHTLKSSSPCSKKGGRKKLSDLSKRKTFRS